MQLRPVGLVACAAIALALSGGCARAPARQPRAPAAADSALRVMTYNVNFGIPGDAPTIEAINAGRADVVFLQEITPAWERALRAALATAYPHTFFHARGGAGGVAVMSRFPISAAEIIRAEGDGFFPALRVVLASPLGPVQALVVHLRPPVSDGGSFVAGYFSAPGIHEREIARFCGKLDRRLPTLVVGDFNEEEDGRAIAYLARAEWGMRSALPEFAPARPTWRWPTSVGTIERRLDHIVYDVRLEPLSTEVIEAGRSDHLPVVGVFVRPSPPAR
jgi:endonuclease/exonuclease/phosphatase (EEP) superfamily protein YafD